MNKVTDIGEDVEILGGSYKIGQRLEITYLDDKLKNKENHKTNEGVWYLIGVGLKSHFYDHVTNDANVIMLSSFNPSIIEAHPEVPWSSSYVLLNMDKIAYVSRLIEEKKDTKESSGIGAHFV